MFSGPSSLQRTIFLIFLFVAIPSIATPPVAIAVSSQASQVSLEPIEIYKQDPPAQFIDSGSVLPEKIIPQEMTHSDSQGVFDGLRSFPSIQVRKQSGEQFYLRGSGPSQRVLVTTDFYPIDFEERSQSSLLFIADENILETRVQMGPALSSMGLRGLAPALAFVSNDLWTQPALRLSYASFDNWRAFAALPVVRPDDHKTQVITVYNESSQNDFPVSMQNLNRAHNDQHLFRLTTAGRRKINETRLKSSVVWAELEKSSPGLIAESVVGPSLRTKSYGFQSGLTAELPAFSGTMISQTHFSLLRSTVNRSSTPQAWATENSNQSHQFQGRQFFIWKKPWSDEVTTKLNLGTVMNDLDSIQLSPHSHQQKTLEWGGAGDIKISPSWNLTPEIQNISVYSSQASATHSNWKSSLILLHQDQKGLNPFWIRIAHSQRPPTLYERFTQTSVVQINSELLSETATWMEAGFFKHPPSLVVQLDGFQWGITFYSAEIKNLIQLQWVDQQSNPVLVSRNLPFSRVFGQEALAALRYGASTWSIHLNHMHWNLYGNSPPLLTPELQAAAAYSYQIGPFVLAMSLASWSSVYDLPNVPDDLGGSSWLALTSPSAQARFNNPTPVKLSRWNSLDFTIRTLGLSNWQLSAGVQNILNQASELKFGYPEPPRRLFISFSLL